MALDINKLSGLSGLSRINSNNNVSASNSSSKGINFSQATGGIGDTFTSSAANGATGVTSAQIQAEIEQLEAKKQENYSKINELEQKIESLIQKAEAKIAEAIKKQENISKEHQEECKKVVEEQMKAYVEANKNGEGMTKDQLNQNIKNALPNVPGLSEAMSGLTETNGIVDEIDSSVESLKSLITETQDLESQIADKQVELEAAIAAEAAAKKCDPIGFEFDGETYDFIVDDGNFDSTSDFLGADNQWDAMQKLDTNGDGSVDTKEMQAGNIKVVNSKGQVGDISKIFGEDFSVDLKSYNKNGSFAGIDTTKDSDGNGVNDQTMLGTFNLNIKGQSVKGYNTLDDQSWLSNKYGISQGVKDTSATKTGKSAGATSGFASQFTGELGNHAIKAEGFEAESARLKQEINAQTEKLGLDLETMKIDDEATASNPFATLGSSKLGAEAENVEDENKKDKLKENNKNQAA